MTEVVGKTAPVDVGRREPQAKADAAAGARRLSDFAALSPIYGNYGNGGICARECPHGAISMVAEEE